MAEPSHCPNCGTEWPAAAAVCPHCGYTLPGPASWPPSPIGLVPTPPPPVPRFVTGKAWGDITFGVTITLASFVVYCLGLIVMPVLYFSLRPQYPFFARGIGYGLLLGVVLILGALGICLYSISNGRVI